MMLRSPIVDRTNRAPWHHYTSDFRERKNMFLHHVNYHRVRMIVITMYLRSVLVPLVSGISIFIKHFTHIFTYLTFTQAQYRIANNSTSNSSISLSHPTATMQFLTAFFVAMMASSVSATGCWCAPAAGGRCEEVAPGSGETCEAACDGHFGGAGSSFRC